MNRLALVTTLLVVTGTADARLHRAWSYPDLMKTADIVVIATPTKTTNTGKLEELPDIKVKAERLETELDVVVVMKGKPATKIVLHHTRESPPGKAMVNGPGFVSFDLKDKRQYLMFLVQEQDGRYVAVSGQTDPDMAIEPLRLR